MLTLLIVTMALLGASLAFEFVLWRKLPRQPAEKPAPLRELRELEKTVELLELKWFGTRQQLMEILSNANETWRKIRQRDYYLRRKEDFEEDMEGESVDADQTVLDLDGEGGDQGGVRGVSEDVGAHSEPTWKQTAKALAQHYARGGQA
jgi:hypothetical protein